MQIGDWFQHPGLTHFLVISAVLFSFGVFAIITRRNAVMVLMGIELILNAANINFVAFSRYTTGTLDGQVIAVFVIILAAAEAAINQLEPALDSGTLETTAFAGRFVAA